MKRTRHLTSPCLAGLAAIALLAGCSSNDRDGTETKAACIDYAQAVNTCWEVATGEALLDEAECEKIDADIDTAMIAEESSCGVKSLAEIYSCYADAFADEITIDTPTCSEQGCASFEGCSTPSACEREAGCSDPSIASEEDCEAAEEDWSTLTTLATCESLGFVWNDTSTEALCEAAGHQWGELLTEEACEAAGERWGTLSTRGDCETAGHTWASTCGANSDEGACASCCTGAGWEGGRLNPDPDAEEPCQCRNYGLCGALSTAGTVDVSTCDYACSRCAPGSQKCDGQKAQYCDPVSGKYKTQLTCPDHTTCNKGECIADEVELPDPPSDPEPATCVVTCDDPDNCDDTSCDGVDDDCDDAIDEDFVNLNTTCGVGACGAAGEGTCVDGQVVDTCVPGDPGADDATCDGVDDDCDGVADEDYVSEDTTCGLGVCQATGATSCEGGVESDSCVILPGANVDDATCDGLDDDCDGDVDEDVVAVDTTCGEGACAATGTTTCDDGVPGDTCAPLAPECGDKTCGDDGCGGSCGECDDGLTCSVDGVCE